MSDSLNRIGKVSSIDYRKGMVSVTYKDRDKSTTRTFPFLCPGNEYLMPKVGDFVLVAHLSNKPSFGVVLGKFFNKDNLPVKYGEGVFRKTLGSNAWIECKNNEISFHDKNGTVTLKQIINALGG